jgi:flavin-dependent thymidylate synthase
MRILLDPKVYLVQKPFLVWEGLNEFLTDNDLLWPTPIEGVPTAQIAIEAAGRLCYDDKTEVLTQNFGWVSFSQLPMLSRSEKILTINPDTEFAEWQIYEDYIEKDSEGTLYVAEGKNVSIAVTPDHRMWGHFQGNLPRNQFTQAKDIGDRVFVLPTASRGWIGEVPRFVEIQRVPYEQSESAANNSRFSEGVLWRGQREVLAWAQLMTYYVTEGYTSQYEVYITGHHTRAVQDLAEVLRIHTSIDVDPRNGCPRVRLSGGKALSVHVSENYGKYAPNKKLSRWILDLPRENLEQIWRIMTITDGDPKRTPRFLSSSPHLMGAAQEILIKIGKGSNHRSSGNLKEGRIKPHHKTFKSSREVFVISAKRPYTLMNRGQKFSTFPYSGKVYCVSTVNGILAVRRDGKVAISGNCYMSYGSKSGSKTNSDYLDNLLGRLEDGSFRPGPAHGSVTEHEHYSFIVAGASRGWSHEQVRHRLNNYSQLSTRYCDYELQDTKPGDWEPAYVIPPLGQLSDRTKELFAEAYEQEREFYVKILHSIEEDLHAKPEFQAQLAKLPPRERSRALRKAARGAAREVLPNGTEALMFMTGNARTIWNEAYLRASGEAEAVIRSVYVQILRIMERQLPDLYKGIQYIKVWDGSEAAVLPKEKL